MTHVLILGGTAEARDLAAHLEAKGVPLTSSLAGRVSRPRLPVGQVRIGGFGGVGGLRSWLQEHDVTAVVDATHPFATTMGDHAAQACSSLGLPLLRLARPGWRRHPDAGSWTWVDSHEAARAAADEVGGTPFVTTGRQTLHHHVDAWRERSVLVRLVEPPESPLPAAWTVLRSRGPFAVADEEAIMRTHDVSVLLTKDSGSFETSNSTYGLNGALLIDLLLAGRVALGEGRNPRVSIVSSAPTGNPVLDRALEILPAKDGKRFSSLVSWGKLNPTRNIAQSLEAAGVVRIHTQAKRAGLRPVIGCQLRLVTGEEFLAYPRDRRGWGHLCRLLTQANERGERETAHLYERVAHHIPKIEWPVYAPYVAAINRLKAERGAVVLAGLAQILVVRATVDYWPPDPVAGAVAVLAPAATPVGQARPLAPRADPGGGTVCFSVF